MNRRTRPATRAAVVLSAAVLVTPVAHAADLYWQGGTGDLGSANYFDATNTLPNVAPTAADVVFVGADGSTTYSTASTTLALSKLRLGHLSTAAGTAAPAGTGSLAISAGTVTAGGTTGGGINSGLLVGYNNSGSLTLTGTGQLTSSFFGKVGYADDPNATGTASVSISDTARLTISNRGLQIGEGLPGSVTITGTGSLRINNGTTGQLAVGVTSTGTFVQTGGSTITGNNVFIGQGSTANSSLSVTGGTFTANGNFYVGDGSSTDASATLGGTAAVTINGNVNVGHGAGAVRPSLTVTDSATLFSTGNFTAVNAAGATGSTTTINGNSTVSVAGNFNLGSNADPNAVLNIGDNATLNVGVAANATTAPSITAHLFIGRSTSTATFNMTGGTVNAPNYALFGTASAGAVVTVNHSAGTINSGTSATSTNRGFKVGDTNGSITYHLSGTGAINSANGPMIVGRQNAVATLNQTGGTVTAAGGLHIGYAENTDVALQTGTGTYVLSGGSVTASLPAGATTAALSIGEQGTGTLRIVGDDATINVTGDVLVNTVPAVDPTPARVGTLAFQLEAGDPGLSMIAATGTATFAAGSVLSLDFNSLTPAASSYNLLTATDVIDSGLTFSGPAGWNFHIISGGNGEILQAFAAAPPRIAGDTNGDGTVDLADLNNVLNNFGATGAGNPGDDNNDGTVDLADLNNVLNNFGATAAVSALSVVPEPSALACLVATLPLLTRRQRRRA